MNSTSTTEAVAGTQTSASPWVRERDEILRLVDRLTSNTKGAIQGIVIQEPAGYGADRLLDLVRYEMALRATSRDATTVQLPTRHDSVTDWPSLITEILSLANEAGAPHGVPRQELIARRNQFGAVAYRASAEATLRTVFETHGRLTLFIPALDELLQALGTNDQWAFRNTLQTQPLAIIATAQEGFRPGREDAFFEFFRLTHIEGYNENDIQDVAKTLRLSKPATRLLVDCRAAVDGRPILVETAAAAIATNPSIPHADLIRSLAGSAPFLAARLATLAPQARLILSVMARLSLPTGAGEIAKAAGLSSGAVSAQLSRLQAAKMIRPTRASARMKAYDFSDAMTATLYRALAGGKLP